MEPDFRGVREGIKVIMMVLIFGKMNNSLANQESLKIVDILLGVTCTRW